MALSARWPAAVILDVDGTMYHQRPVRTAMLLRLLRHAAARPMDGLGCLRALRAYRRAQETLRGAPGAGPARAEQLRLAAQGAGLDEATASRHVERWMETEPLTYIPRAARPGLRAFLAVARTHGARVGVFSDYPAEQKLRALGVRELVDVVRTAHDEEGRFKPDPAGLLAVAAALGVRPADAVYVGDRPEVDGAAAARAGMPCYIIAGAAAGPPSTWLPVAGFAELTQEIFPESA